MSYHGPHDNGEGRPRDMNQNGSQGSGTIEAGSTTDATRPASSSSSIIASLPTPMSDITIADHPIDPEITPDRSTYGPPPTPPHLRPILTLLRGTSRTDDTDRSRSPPRDTSAIREALQIFPHHQVRSHIQAVLAQPPGDTTGPIRARSTISARLASFANSRDDAIEDSWYCNMQPTLTNFRSYKKMLTVAFFFEGGPTNDVTSWNFHDSSLTCHLFACRYLTSINFPFFCTLGSKNSFAILIREINMVEIEEDFQDILRQLHLPEDVRDALLPNGYDCTLTFGLAFSSLQMLDQHINKFLPPGETDLTSPTCARIRALSMDQMQQFTYSYTYSTCSTIPTHTSSNRTIISTHCHLQLAWDSPTQT